MIAIIDYQMGNLRSVQKGFERVGFSAEVTCDRHVLLNAEKVVLPGVGAFADAMTELRRRDLVEPIRDIISRGTPFLGICLGLQLLFDVGLEGGSHEGLGVLAGRVVPFKLPRSFKVPHMGWNEARRTREDTILEGIADPSYFYFVHSYIAVPDDPAVTLLEADYGGPFCAMIRQGNLYASQFHPEKSQSTGLRLLENFARVEAV